MNIETKFNLKDSVWFMDKNEPVNVIVSCIEVFKVGTSQDSITYNAKNIIGSVSWLDHTKLHEYQLFGSKRELIESLFNVETVCRGIELGDGNFSGCDQSAGDCPSCGK